MYLLYFGDIPNLVSCAFSTIPIFPPFNSQNFLFTCLCSFFTCFAVLEESRSFAPPKKQYGHVGHQVRARTFAQAQQLHNFVVQSSTVGRACSKKTAFCVFFPWLEVSVRHYIFAWQLRSGATPSRLAS